MTAPRRSFFAMVPKLVDELGLDTYAYRLYGHIKAVAGENGACWQSTRTLAAACGMSLGKVTEAKRVLVAAGLIRIEKRGGRGGRYDVITPVDIWARNHARYARRSQGDKPRSRDNDSRSRDNDSRSRDDSSRSQSDKMRSPDDQMRSPGERKKIPHKEETRQEPKEDLDGSLSENQKQRPSDTPPEAAQWAIVLEGLKGMMLRDDFAALFAPTCYLGFSDDGAWRIAVPGHYQMETLNRPRSRVLLSRGLRYAGVPDIDVRYEIREPSDG